MGQIRVGDFALERVIGKGGMGRVWSGRHSVLGTPVAVKILFPTQDERPRDALRNEIRAMARLDHPGIAWIYDYGEVSEAEAAASGGSLIPHSPWIAMELASGGSLVSIPRLMGWAELRPFLHKLLDALAHAHAHDLIHRDLKPANILICSAEDQRPGIKLTDFGIAQALDEVAQAHRIVVGTPQYMAPEQVVGAFRRAGPWTDLYAFGCVAWLLATGRRVFEGMKGPELAKAQLTQEPGDFRPLVNVPEGFEGWLRQLLQKHPADRFRCAADAAWALAKLPDAPEEQSLPLDIPGLSTMSELSDMNEYGPEDYDTEIADVTEEAVVTERVLARHAPIVADMPPTWRRAMPDRTPRRVGTALFGLRAIPVVGRTEIRDALWAGLAEVRRKGRMKVMLVRGMSGVGKSRIAEWMVQRSREVGAAEVIRAHFKEGASTGEALRAGFRRAFHITGFEEDLAEKLVRRTLRDLGAEDPALLAGAYEVLKPDSMMDSDSRYVLMNMLLALFCRQRAHVVWLDDLQWGLDGIRWIASLQATQSRRPLPVLVLGTVQEEGLAERPALAAELDALETTTLELGPLPAPHQSELVETMLGLEPRLAARVVERTQGNPLFAVQLVGDWVERGALEQGEHGLQLRTVGGELPSSIEDLLNARIEKLLFGLPSFASDMLEAAAVIGPDVDFIEWQLACDDPEGAVRRSGAFAFDRQRAEVRRKLEERLISARLAEETDEGFRFSHAMIVEALRERARREGRHAMLNAAAAEMLLAREGDPSVAERLGRHLLEAGRPEEAVEPLLQGVKLRRNRLGNQAALALVEVGLRAARYLPERDPRRWKLQIEHVQILTNLGEYEAALDLLDQLDPQLGEEPVLAAMSRVVRAQIARDQGEVSACERAALEAAALLGTDGSPELLGQAWWMATLAAVDTGRQSLVRERAELCQSALMRSGDDHGRAEAHRMMSYLHTEEDDHAGAVHHAREALELYRGIGSVSGQARTLLALGNALRSLGDLDEAEGVLNESLDRFEAWSTNAAYKARVALAFVKAEKGEHAAAYAVVGPIVRDPDVRTERFALSKAWVVMVEACAGLALWAEYDHALAEAGKQLKSRQRKVTDDADSLDRAADLANRHGFTARAQRARELAKQQR
ncbi:MAG: protein kinase [Alphaproteobacteria bacterium]|nr:protein kinase [Alphaproteobacteria bacterium]